MKNTILRIKYFFYLSLIILPTSLTAQDLGSSPYSRFGVGDLINPGFAHQAGMSYVGTSYLKPNYINNTNPALLGQTLFTILEAGVIGQVKQIQSNTNSQQDFGVSINYVGIAFPILPQRWGMSLGLQPFSSVQYNNFVRRPVENSIFTADYNYQGSGGINQVYWSNGFRFLDHLYLGFKASYIFGSTIEESSVILNTGEELSNNTLYQRDSYQGLAWQFGGAYRYPISESTFLNIGATYTLEQDINLKNLTTLQIRNLSGTPLLGDTFQNNDRSIIALPAKIQAGISLNKTYKWMFAAEVSLQNWESYQENNNTDTLRQSVSIAVGGEFTPDYQSSNFLQRSTYRAGFRYTQLPIFVNGTQLTDMSLSTGIAFPFNRGYSELNLAFTLGRRGTLDNNLLRENYLRFFLGITINDRWFVKRKID